MTRRERHLRRLRRGGLRRGEAQHLGEVLLGLGYSDDEVARLRASRIV